MRGLLIVGLMFAGISTGDGQSSAAATSPSRAGKRRLLPPEVEISLARSAAPASVSGAATVLVFTDTGFVVGAKGSNGVTCIVNRSWPSSIEPHCYDREGAETMLKIQMRKLLLLHEGKSGPDVDRVIADGLSSGEFRLPARPAMSYMMSEAQSLIGDDGRPAGNWRPHIMIYYPYLSNDAVGLSSVPDMAVGLVVDSGKPTANLMVIMPQFVKVVPRTP
jgi:hypothetical protein